jgi:hypothetical protein
MVGERGGRSMSFLRRKPIHSKNSITEHSDGLYATRDDISEDRMIVLTFDDTGTICNCNYAGGIFLECLPKELIGRPISSVLPELTDNTLFQSTQSIPRLLHLSRIGHHFEVVRLSGMRFSGNLFFSDVKNNHGPHRIRVIICPTMPS